MFDHLQLCFLNQTYGPIFFFFQAEDGIRDLTVNGVQTCALPIFSAAHRLHVPSFSDEKNAALFGKCDNPRGHGHLYLAEATLGGNYDERSGTLYEIGRASCRERV